MEEKLVEALEKTLEGSMALLQGIKRKREQDQVAQIEQYCTDITARIKQTTTAATPEFHDERPAARRTTPSPDTEAVIDLQNTPSTADPMKNEQQAETYSDKLDSVLYSDHSHQDLETKKIDDEIAEMIAFKYPLFDQPHYTMSKDEFANMEADHSYEANAMDIGLLYFYRKHLRHTNPAEKKQFTLISSQEAQLIFGDKDGLKKDPEGVARSVVANGICIKNNAIVTTEKNGCWIGFIILNVSTALNYYFAPESQELSFDDPNLGAKMANKCVILIFDRQGHDKTLYQRLLFDIKIFLYYSIRFDHLRQREPLLFGLNSISTNYLVVDLHTQQEIDVKDSGPLVLCHIDRYFKKNTSLDHSNVVPNSSKHKDAFVMKNHASARLRCRQVFSTLCNLWEYCKKR